MIRTFLGAAFGLTLAAGVPASAACVQADAAGSWAAYSAGTTNGAYYWFKCRFAFGTGGKITTGSCMESNGLSSPVTGSIRLTEPADCTFTAALDFTKFKQKATVDQATLSLDKQAVLGIGTVGTARFTFNMLKIR